MARRPANPKPAYSANRDRLRSLRDNKRADLAHSRDLAKRLNVKKVESAEEGERLHVRIARSGLCSRRAAEKLILEGRVSVDGRIVMQMGVKVDPDSTIAVDGQPIATPKLYTVALYKPAGVVTTLSDPQGRPTIVKYLPDYGCQLKPVGRLDMDTSGLLLVTNDGEMANRIAHPRHGIEKEYQAIVRGIPDETALNHLRKGVFVEGRKTAPAKVFLGRVEERAGTTMLKIILHEGRKRQVRLMCEAVGHPVITLKRVRVGSLVLKGMRAGEARLLSKVEVDKLRHEVGLPPS
jgi:23S rRNA pseudouridine2605 synthase